MSLPKVTISDGLVSCLYQGNAFEKVYTRQEARELGRLLLQCAGRALHYSGDDSGAFWQRVNALKDTQSEMYSLGVALQNLEEQVIKRLEECEKEKVYHEMA